MSPATVSIQTDSAVKDAAERIFEGHGLTLSSAVNLFLLRTVQENAIPFDFGEEIPNETTVAAIEEGRRIAYSKDYQGYHSIEELRRALDV